MNAYSFTYIYDIQQYTKYVTIFSGRQRNGGHFPAMHAFLRIRIIHLTFQYYYLEKYLFFDDRSV